MNFKRFVTLCILAALITGLAAFSGVETSDAMGDARWGRPTSTPTFQPSPTPTQPSGGGSGTVDYGSLYGDLYVILRDINGVPILDQYGCVQPISVITGGTLSTADGPGCRHSLRVDRGNDRMGGNSRFWET